MRFLKIMSMYTGIFHMCFNCLNVEFEIWVCELDLSSCLVCIMQNNQMPLSNTTWALSYRTFFLDFGWQHERCHDLWKIAEVQKRERYKRRPERFPNRSFSTKTLVLMHFIRSYWERLRNTCRRTVIKVNLSLLFHIRNKIWIEKEYQQFSFSFL